MHTPSTLHILGSGVCLNDTDWEKENRWPPGYVLEHVEKELILIEASEGVRFRFIPQGLQFTNVGHIFLSHIHPDHAILTPLFQSLSVQQLWTQNQKFERKQIHLYGPPGIKDFFWTIWNLSVPEFQFSVYNFLEVIFHEYAEKQPINLAHSTVTPFKVFHAGGKVDAYAIRFEAQDKIFTYSGDTGVCEGVTQAAKDADLFLCDSSSDIGQDKSSFGHLNPREAATIAHQAGAHHLLLTHYSGKHRHTEMIQDARTTEYSGEITVVQDRQTFAL